jgi:hypothetical protein
MDIYYRAKERNPKTVTTIQLSPKYNNFKLLIMIKIVTKNIFTPKVVPFS